MKKRRGFSLAELSLIVLVIAILSAGVVYSADYAIDDARRSKTKQDMMALQMAIATYMNDHRLSSPPSNLGILMNNLDSADSRDGRQKGPYIKKANWTSSDSSTWVDAWGNPYNYSPSGRTLSSTGNGSAITVQF